MKQKSVPGKARAEQVQKDIRRHSSLMLAVHDDTRSATLSEYNLKQDKRLRLNGYKAP